jgi:hypothetical protein
MNCWPSDVAKAIGCVNELPTLCRLVSRPKWRGLQLDLAKLDKSPYAYEGDTFLYSERVANAVTLSSLRRSVSRSQKVEVIPVRFSQIGQSARIYEGHVSRCSSPL